MFFFIFFALVMLTIIFIGVYPAVKENILKGNIKKNLKLIFLWLIASGFGTFVFFRMRIIYTPLSVYEEFWQSTMVFIDNIILGILIVISIALASTIYKALIRSAFKSIYYFFSLLLIVFNLQSIVHYLVNYYIIGSEIDMFLFFFWILFLVFSSYLFYLAQSLVDYNLKDIFQSFYR